MKLVSPTQSVTLHTDLGNIQIELFCELVPKACEVGKFSLSRKLAKALFEVSLWYAVNPETELFGSVR